MRFLLLADQLLFTDQRSSLRRIQLGSTLQATPLPPHPLESQLPKANEDSEW